MITIITNAMLMIVKNIIVLLIRFKIQLLKITIILPEWLWMDSRLMPGI